MANKIVLKKSSVALKVPLSTDLDVGEIAVNLVDQKLYSKKADGTVVLVGTGISGGTGDVTGAASSTDNAVTRFDGTTGKVIQNSAVIIDDSNNITGVNSLTATTLVVNDNVTLGSSNTDTVAVNGRITTDVDPNANNAHDIGTSGRNWRDGFFGRNLSTVNLSVTGTTSYDGAQGTSGQVLTSAGTGNTPTWTTPTVGTVTSVGGTGTVNGITLTGTVTTAGDLTLGGTLTGVNLTTQVTGTLPVANGGTGAATLAANNVLLGNGTSAPLTVAPSTSGNVLTSNGTTWVSSAAPAGAAATPTALGTVYANTERFTDKTSLGYEAGKINTGARNTFVGYQAGLSNTNSADNTAQGFEAIKLNTTGSQNTAFGTSTLSANTTGAQNTALGSYALNMNTTASSNTGIGVFALIKNTTGARNTAIGAAALSNNTTGFDNTATGRDALLSNTTGANNTVNGFKALRSSTGSNNTVLGYQAGNSGTNDLTTGANNILIGYTATASSSTVSNEITIGNSSNTVVRFPHSYSTVSVLPSAVTVGRGARTFVTDALAPVFQATVAGGGAVFTPVYSDGTNWMVG